MQRKNQFFNSILGGIMNKLNIGARILLGLIFFVFGLNGFLNFLPMPALPEAAGAFLGALAQSGYMFPMIKGVEVLAGLMLLAGWQVPLAQLLLSPIIINIFVFHLFLTGAASVIGVPLLIVVLQIIVALSMKEKYRVLFTK